MDRRAVIGGLGAGALLPAATGPDADLRLPGGPSLRPIARDFAGKHGMIVQRVRPPLLETPRDVFDSGVFTPNDRFFVRWSGGVMPTSIDAAAHRVTIHGAVRRPLQLTLAEIAAAGETVEIAAVNQCAGNGRGLQTPRVQGAQWGNGAMGNARWRGVRLRDVLDRAGLTGAARRVRFAGLDAPLIAGAPHFRKSLPVDVARGDDIILAWAMNGQPLPVLNGAPLRLVVPGWYGTYWVKLLNDIEALTGEDDSYFMAKTYRLPTVPVKPGDKGFPTVPVTTMAPRSFVTSPDTGSVVPRGRAFEVRGIAMGGDCGVARVDVLVDGRVTARAMLETDYGPYSFRRWRAVVRADGAQTVIASRCTNTRGVAQPFAHSWNPSGYNRSLVEGVTLATRA